MFAGSFVLLAAIVVVRLGAEGASLLDWIVIALLGVAGAAGLVNRHYHPHEVFAYTISGKWGYLEHDWTATAGDFVYETPGESHTLVAYEHVEPMRTLFIVTGPLIWLDEDGKPDGYFDVHQYIAMCKAHYEKVGLGADLITKLFR